MMFGLKTDVLDYISMLFFGQKLTFCLEIDFLGEILIADRKILLTEIFEIVLLVKKLFCTYDYYCYTPDAIIAAKITGFTKVEKTDEALIEALASGSISVRFDVTNNFRHYLIGIIQDDSCTERANHEVVAVWYTARYILVNSWGTTWGDQDFVKFARGYNTLCGLYRNNVYLTLVSTGHTDICSAEATTYRPDDDDGEDDAAPPCWDRADNCNNVFCFMSHITGKY